MTASAPPVAVWCTRCPVPTATGVAIDTGLLSEGLARCGARVASITGTAAGEAHFDHRLPALFREGGNVPALWARGRGEDTRLIGLTWVPEMQAIVARRDSGLRDASDLAGARVVLPTHGGDRVDFFRAMALRGIDATLRAHGLDLRDIVLVDVPSALPGVTDTGAEGFYGSTLRALEEGLGDVAYLKGAPGADALAAADLVVLHDLATGDDRRGQVNNGTPRTLTVSAALLDERPDIVAQYVATLRRTARWAASHPAEVAAVVTEETGSSPAGVARAYGPDLHARLEPALPDTWLDLLEDQRRFLVRHNIVADSFTVADWADRRPLLASAALLDGTDGTDGTGLTDSTTVPHPPALNPTKDD
ncbi:hypothetical protein KVF89_25015 [Nocardioides carbamazepini]|uniref:ABC transporter substrate-binding protein n=1 Tax=Nocardioides carbamazepini TaxID=2854259 RepID=UPI00214A3964|nr:hypothetical protein [Nocardioides carbamazepini]MCR1785823.1 hypothetical protein [Nocardioides carbamazepini]